VDNREAATTSASASIMVDTPQGYQPPVVQVRSPLDNTTYQLPTTVGFTASVAYASSPITSLQFLIDGVAVGPGLTNAPFTMTTGTIDAGVHAVQAVVTDAFGVVVASPTNRITVLPETSSALFHGYDFTTQGTWEQLYGSEGFIIVNSETNVAVYCTAAPVGDSSYFWAYSTSDSRALENPAGVGRFAGVWFARTNFLLDLNLFDGSTHRIALYCLDWDNTGRLQTIDVLNRATGTLLDTRSVGNFESGVYLVWDLTGHVQFRFTGDPSSVVPVLSGVFFDPPSTGPQVRLLAPTDSTTFAISTPIQFSALAISGAADLSRVEFLTNGTLLGSTTAGSPYTIFWTNPPAGVYAVTARAVDTNGNSSVSAPASIAVITNSSTALFVSYDTNHLGNWIGNFGLQGFVLAGGRSNPPPFVQLTVNGGFLSWARTSDTRALQSVAGGVREAAAWFAFGGLDVRANFADASFHRISLYFLEWGNPFESESVDVLDMVSGALLDHRDLPSLWGVYAVWDVKGQLVFHITRASASPALLSGIFFDQERVLPLITIINPPNGAFFFSPTNIALSANAASDPRVSSVGFYGDGTLLGTVGGEPPYSLVWTNAPVGVHSLVAHEVGPLDTADSSPVSITVLSTNSLAFLGGKMLSNGSLQLDAFGPASQPIRLQAAATLDTNAIWLPLMTNTSVSGRFQFIIPDPAVYQQRFYRMVRPQKHK
jgi:hypothetical protein